MIFYDIVELNLKVGDIVKVFGISSIDIVISLIDDGKFPYNSDYTRYGIYFKNTQYRLFNSLEDSEYIFKKFLCNKIRRIIPI